MTELRLAPQSLRSVTCRVLVRLLIAWCLGLSGLTYAQPNRSSAGSIFVATGPLGNPAHDLRASTVGDIVTIVVSDQASAAASGGTNTKRNSSGKDQIAALMGTLSTGSPLANLLNFANTQQLQGQGQTTRDLTLSTTISARVVATTLSGLLVLEAAKEITVNSERHVVMLRGMARQVDVSPANTILSDQISDLSLSVNGKGVVNDAIKRRFSLFRIFTDLLPF